MGELTQAADARHLSEAWRQASLLAQFVGRDSLKCSMPFHGYDLVAVRVDRVVATFPKKPESMLLKIPDKVASFDGHIIPRRASAR